MEVDIQHFHEQLDGIPDADRASLVYQTENFTARYLDEKGGYMEIDKANVRLYVPPGAIKQLRMIYIRLEPGINGNVQGKVSPVVEVGPPGTTFMKRVTLSYPHCAVNESEWRFTTLICESNANSWKDIAKDDGVECSVKNGRVIIKFATIGEQT